MARCGRCEPADLGGSSPALRRRDGTYFKCLLASKMATCSTLQACSTTDTRPCAEGQDMRALGFVVCSAVALFVTACGDGSSKGGAPTPPTLMAPPTGQPVNPGMPVPSLPK